MPTLTLYLEDMPEERSLIPVEDTLCTAPHLHKYLLMCRTNVKYRGQPEMINWLFRNSSGSYKIADGIVYGWTQDKQYYRKDANTYFVAARLCSTSLQAQVGQFVCKYKYNRYYPVLRKYITITNSEFLKYSIHGYIAHTQSTKHPLL